MALTNQFVGEQGFASIVFSVAAVSLMSVLATTYAGFDPSNLVVYRAVDQGLTEIPDDIPEDAYQVSIEANTVDVLICSQNSIRDTKIHNICGSKSWAVV